MCGVIASNQFNIIKKNYWAGVYYAVEVYIHAFNIVLWFVSMNSQQNSIKLRILFYRWEM